MCVVDIILEIVFHLIFMAHVVLKTAQIPFFYLIGVNTSDTKKQCLK